MAQALSDIYNSLNSAYQPQREAYQQQYNSIDGQTQSQVAGLNAQKDLAFRDIDNHSNDSGMYYSGQTRDGEQRYTGATWAPAMANLATNAQNQKFGLQAQIAGVGQQQMGAASGMYQNQQAQEQQAKQFQQQMTQQAQYNASNLALTQANNRAQYQQATPQQALASAFQGYDPHKSWYTEQQAAPAISASLGIPLQQALQQAYQYRKQVYGN